MSNLKLNFDPHRTKTQSFNRNKAEVVAGMFAGLIEYADGGESYIVSCVLLEEFQGTPLLFKSSSGFGSSDHDMMYTVKFYLQKKD